MRAIVTPVRPLRGTVAVPGDKSVSHRAAILGALAEGVTEITGFLEGEDCLRTVEVLQALGVEISREGKGRYRVIGRGLDGLREPEDILDCGNSGTTLRLMMGVLAGQTCCSVLTGDRSLRRRPVGRIADPLRQMGATILGRDGGRLAPVLIQGARPLRPIHYRSPLASAQVKSAILLAGLAALGTTVVEEPSLSRDHTERMLRAFGARLESEGEGTTTALSAPTPLKGRAVAIPGDISSAAFFLVAGTIVPDSAVAVTGVGVNSTRTGILEMLAAMGARPEMGPISDEGEPVADLTVRHTTLHAIDVAGSIIPRLIDEIPILAVAAACADGVSQVRDARELRVKESDRISAIASELGKLGVKIEELEDGFRIHGGRGFRGNVVQSWGDHRIAMALIVAGLVADGSTVVEDVDCIATSYPDFIATLETLTQRPVVRIER